MILYVSDLDGTLLDNNAKISNESSKLLNNALKNNVNFTIATARTPATVVNLLKEINIKLPIVTMNGSAIYDIKTNTYLNYTSIPSNSAKKIKDIISTTDLNVFVYTLKNNHLFVYHKHLTNPYQINFYNERKNTPYKTFIEADCPDDANVLYFTTLDSEDKINTLYEKLKNIDDLYVVKYKDSYNEKIVNLEVFSINASKANAILYLKKHYNFDKLVVFGDNLNDMPMFKIADECYAVKNAVPELKNIATGVIGANTEDSVAKYINL